MNARILGLSVFALLVGCALPPYAEFDPLTVDGDDQRVEREGFSIEVPEGFELRAGGRDELMAVQSPPKDGGMRVLRRLEVHPAPVLHDDDDERMQAAALAQLAVLRARDGYTRSGTGRARFADRTCYWQRGRMSGGAANVWLDVVDWLVPGDPKSLCISAIMPEGQLDASLAAFEAYAATLQTTYATPKDGPNGALAFHDGGRIGLRVPAGWLLASEAAPVLARYTQTGGAWCELSSRPQTGALDLPAIVRAHQQELAAELTGFRVLSIEWRSFAGKPAARLRGTGLVNGNAVVVDDTFVGAGERLDRLRFQVPVPSYVAQRGAIDRAAGSLRWK